MAGTRQYNNLNDINFNIFNRNQTIGLQDFIANTGGLLRPAGGTVNVLTNANIAALSAAVTRVGGAGTSDDYPIFSVTGIVPFDNSQSSTGAVPGAGDYDVHIIRDATFDCGATGGFNINGITDVASRGTHVIFVNCTFIWRDPIATPTGAVNYGFRYNTLSTTTGLRFNSGFGPGGRNNDIAAAVANNNVSPAIASSRSMNFYGCTFDINQGTSTDERRYAVGEMEECTFIDSTLAPGSGFNWRSWLILTPGTEIRNCSIQTSGTVVHGLGPGLLNISGATGIDATDTRGFSYQILDSAQVKVFGATVLPDQKIMGFNLGVGDANTLSYFKSVNPVTTVGNGNSQTGTGTAVSYAANNQGGWRANCRYVELLQYAPLTFETPERGATATPAQGISYQAGYDLAFATNDTYTTATTGNVATTYNYISDAQGQLVGAGAGGVGYVPDTGIATAAIPAGDGLQIPVSIYAQTAGAPTVNVGADQVASASTLDPIGTSTVTARSFWHLLGDLDGTVTNGENSLDINKALLDDRSFDARAGSAVDEAGITTSVDLNLAAAARLTTRTPAALMTYFEGLVTSNEAGMMQHVADATKWLHYLRTPAVPFRTVANNTASFAANVTFATTGTVPSFATGTLTIPGNAQSSTNEPVRALNITGAVDFGGQSPDGAQITATTLQNLPADGTSTSYTGGSLAGSYTGATGDTIVFANGTDLTGFTADTTVYNATNQLVIAGNFTNFNATANPNIQVSAEYRITNLTAGDYLGVYDVTGPVDTPVLAPRGTLSRLLTAADLTNGQFIVPSLSATDRLRIVVTSVNADDFIVNDTVSPTDADNETAYIRSGQSISTEVVAEGSTVAPPVNTIPAGQVPEVTTIDLNGTNDAITVRLTNARPDYQLSPSQTASIILNGVKTTAEYNRVVAEVNDTANTQIIQSVGATSPIEANAERVTFDTAAGASTFQAIGFVLPTGDGTGSLVVSTVNNGTGVFIYPSTTFDLPLTISSLETTVSSDTYITNVTNPAINAIRNFLQLSDN